MCHRQICHSRDQAHSACRVQVMKFNRHTENLIANLRGLPEDRGRSIRRTTVTLSDLVDTVFERYKVNQPRLEDTIMANWKNIVGEKTAHRCSPVKIMQQKRLVVFTANSIVRSELKFNQRVILKKINALPNCENIRELVLQTR